MRYRILDGNDEKKFHLDISSGQIKVLEALAASSGPFKLHIQAYDNFGNNPTKVSTNYAVITIMIERSGENSVIMVLEANHKDVLKNEKNIIRYTFIYSDRIVILNCYLHYFHFLLHTVHENYNYSVVNVICVNRILT